MTIRTNAPQHPLLQPSQLRLETPAIARLREDCQRWLWTGVRGALLLGPSQVGKTTALVTLCNKLVTRGQRRVPTFYVSIPDRDTNTITAVLRALCHSAQLSLNGREVADTLSDRFVHVLVDSVHEHQVDVVVLMVDEVQRLQLGQFNVFAEISDKLRLLGIDLLVLFAGNDSECGPMLERVRSQQYAHIFGRFFRQTSLLQGLVSAREVAQVLGQYDSLRYPPGDGPTYTEWALPEAVANGWQLAELSQDLWRCYRVLAKQFRLSSWGMGDFIISTNALLVDYLPAVGVQRVDDGILNDCIQLAGVLAKQVEGRG
ncbi:ATP-binding protein [Marinobacter alexandrii]|uniref:ATP-binding protein n=1 Tax=Marinobacter alexandrii TaxID=2570351 RepID=UPI001486B811|nr:ATP-binding protein [Marinobacter alexandrii]